MVYLHGWNQVSESFSALTLNGNELLLAGYTSSNDGDDAWKPWFLYRTAGWFAVTLTVI